MTRAIKGVGDSMAVNMTGARARVWDVAVSPGPPVTTREYECGPARFSASVDAGVEVNNVSGTSWP